MTKGVDQTLLRSLEEIDERLKKEAALVQGAKFDGDKVRTDLHSVPSFLGTCAVLTYGAKKYAAWNWSKGINYMRVYGALIRHLTSWVMGQKLDEETGLPHLDHAACCVMFLQHYDRHSDRYKAFDDRPYDGKVA